MNQIVSRKIQILKWKKNCATAIFLFFLVPIFFKLSQPGTQSGPKVPFGSTFSYCVLSGLLSFENLTVLTFLKHREINPPAV